jgi:hypothetical protein
MLNLGEQADVLRALGRSLDQQGATGVEIKCEASFLAVFWLVRGTRTSQRAYQEHDLESLRLLARRLRQGTAPGNPGGRLADLLRTIGQELDEAQIEASAIVQEDDGFRVSGTRSRRYVTHLYYTYELLELNDQRRTVRGTTDGEPPQADPYRWVRLGMEVFTRDNVRLGTVGEVASEKFKVSTPLFHRDYWLPADYVSRTMPSATVSLGLTKAELEERRQHKGERSQPAA